MPIPAPGRSRQVREPLVFNGEPSLLKEWVFSMELALSTLGLSDPRQEVNYASSFLAGNARLWLMAALEAGEQFPHWYSLRKGLENVYGPRHNEEQSRLKLFALVQEGTVDTYIEEFTRLSLLIPALDEHSRALLFVRGLSRDLARDVLKEHPKTLSDAFQATVAVHQSREHLRNVGGEQTRESKPTQHPRNPGMNPAPSRDFRGPRSSRRNPAQSRESGADMRCYNCQGLGHMARDCPRNPNAGRQ